MAVYPVKMSLPALCSAMNFVNTSITLSFMYYTRPLT